MSCDSQGNTQLNLDESTVVERMDNAWMVERKVMQGTTQGTTFTIKTSEEELLVTPVEISELFAEFDDQLSGYIDTSFLSVFNLPVSGAFDLTGVPFFKKCFELSQEVYRTTDGAFDPSVFPLVSAWGFFKDMNTPPTAHEIDSILMFVGFEEGKFFRTAASNLIKLEPRFQLDFNAIAQGFSVDVVADLLKKKGHQNFYVEIGGELYAEGVNNEGTPWIIGVDLPEEENTGVSGPRELENYIYLSSKGLATSGNYRKFYERDGMKYSHTLHPKNGRPVTHNLLSATVIANSAALADGYATAFMVMGVEATLAFVADHPELEIDVYLLFQNDAGRIERAYSSGMQRILGNE
jgi:FAD:protein FMN transferase